MCSETTAPKRQTDDVVVDEIVVKAVDLGKCYRVYDRPIDRLKQVLIPGASYFSREHWSLKGVSFEVRRGEVVGIVGRNGAGKSTLLQIVAGILAPSEGRLERRGRTFPLLELGSGFDPEFSGAENIRMNGAILGLKPWEMDAIAEDVVAFADIGEYIDQPVKTYSSGMHARLALALAFHLPAELLLIDEVISVGDVFFQMKCYQRLEQLVESGRTVLLCSHDLGAVRRYCSRALYFREGLLVLDGDPDTVLTEYLKNGQSGSPSPPPGHVATHASAAEADPSAPAPAGRPTPPAIDLMPTAGEWSPDDKFVSTIRSPRGLVALDSGNLLIADLFSHGVWEADRTGRIVSRWSQEGFSTGQLYDPVGLEKTRDGRIVAADYSSSRLVAMGGPGSASDLFGGARIGRQVFLVRYGFDGRAWVSSRADRRVSILDERGRARKVFSRGSRKRYITDIAFRGGDAYLVDFANDEILVVDQAGLSIKKTIRLEGLPRARAPHGIAFFDGYMLITCHDSHSLLAIPINGDLASAAIFDLRENVIEHPCYVIVRGMRAYVSASTLGGVVALDLSGWAAGLSRTSAPGDNMRQGALV